MFPEQPLPRANGFVLCCMCKGCSNRVSCVLLASSGEGRGEGSEGQVLLPVSMEGGTIWSWVLSVLSEALFDEVGGAVGFALLVGWRLCLGSTVGGPPEWFIWGY